MIRATRLLRNLTIGGVLGLAGAACEQAGPTLTGAVFETGELADTSPLGLVFEEAAAERNLPVDLLKAVAMIETSFHETAGEVEFDGKPGVYGVFALDAARLARAAQLLAASESAIKSDVALGVRAAAALLDVLADEHIDPSRRDDPTAWKTALKAWSGADPELSEVYAADVLGLIRRGVAVPLSDGSNLVIRRRADLSEVGHEATGLGAEGAVFRASPNHSGRSTGQVKLVVIHSCEGAYSGCASWLRSRESGVSAHYVVKEDGSEVSQLVDEERRAWHVAARYRSRLNDGVMSEKDGSPINDLSVGIENAGFAGQRLWPEAQITRTAELVRDITERWSIPRDRYHIVGHGRMQPENRIDPGPNWPWTQFLAQVQAGAAPAEPNPSDGRTIITVDNSSSEGFRGPDEWDYSSWASGRVGSNYRYRSACSEDASGRLAEFRAVVTEGAYEVFVRVPGNGYNPASTYVVRHAEGQSSVTRDVSRLGATWVPLGTYRFEAGRGWIVAVDCASPREGYVIADAIRLEPR
ncbi:MAG: N-acetylmuramoyl-L-alanine amidase [Deltaproteobacteria bacterium]|nr:N-acetylmuramoyl-L-alanine amidase [Deltaproteobacteria bacterium]